MQRTEDTNNVETGDFPRDPLGILKKGKYRILYFPSGRSSFESLTPVAGPFFETKNRANFLERFFGRGITARQQFSRAVILARF